MIGTSSSVTTPWQEFWPPRPLLTRFWIRFVIFFLWCLLFCCKELKERKDIFFLYNEFYFTFDNLFSLLLLLLLLLGIFTAKDCRNAFEICWSTGRLDNIIKLCILLLIERDTVRSERWARFRTLNMLTPNSVLSLRPSCLPDLCWKFPQIVSLPSGSSAVMGFIRKLCERIASSLRLRSSMSLLRSAIVGPQVLCSFWSSLCCLLSFWRFYRRTWDECRRNQIQKWKSIKRIQRTCETSRSWSLRART